MRFISIILFSCLFSQELEVEGDLKITGNVLFEDSSTINTAPKDLPSEILLTFAGSTAPDGWLLCADQEINRDTCSNLFAVIDEF